MADTDFLDNVHLGENHADDRDDCRSHVFERRRRLPLLGQRRVLEARLLRLPLLGQRRVFEARLLKMQKMAESS